MEQDKELSSYNREESMIDKLKLYQRMYEDVYRRIENELKKTRDKLHDE